MELFYEHQRAVARTLLKFDCRALEDYPAAERLFSSIDNEPEFTADMSLKDRMDLV